MPILAALVLLAGCVDVDRTDEPSSSTPASTPSHALGGCTQGSETLLDWAGPQDPAEGAHAEESFDVRPGTERLDVTWEAPSASAGSYDMRLTGPAGEDIFVDAREGGVSAGGSDVNVVGANEHSQNVQQPPSVGNYTFTLSSSGAIQGGVAKVEASGCW